MNSIEFRLQRHKPPYGRGEYGRDGEPWPRKATEEERNETKKNGTQSQEYMADYEGPNGGEGFGGRWTSSGRARL